MSLIRILRDAGYEIHFASPARDNLPAQELRATGVQTRAIAPNDSAFDSWIADLRPEVVILERFMMEEQFGWRVARHAPQALRVLDTVDLHFVRRARQEAWRSPPKDGALSFAGEDALREVASIHRSDLSLVLSDFEAQLLSDPRGLFRIPEAQLHEMGLSYDPPPPPRDVSSRRDFVFIGTFRHDPNADAVRWLHQELWPAIHQRLPEAQLHVYGAYPPRELMRLDDARTGFRMMGQASDQYETLGRYRVNLAPLRFGAGLKGKIADGWWSGTPCVSTEIGAEGMKLGDGRFGGLVADDARSFADAACRLYNDEALLQTARMTGAETLAARFDHATHAARLLARIQNLGAQLDQHRAGCFTGRMLAHHMHRSTEYFSRWIESKSLRSDDIVRRSPPPAVDPAPEQA